MMLLEFLPRGNIQILLFLADSLDSSLRVVSWGTLVRLFLWHLREQYLELVAIQGIYNVRLSALL